MRLNNAKSFGKAVRAFRKRQKVTKAQMAAVANTGIRFINKLENGKPTVQLNNMKRNNVFLLVIGFFVTISLIGCATTSHYNFSLKNTLAIFMLNNGKNYHFAIPIQYIGDYQIQSFEFDHGYILIGEYKIVLERDDLSIEMFVSETSDESGNIGLGNLNQYNFFIKYILKKRDMDNITNEYKKGNTYSQFYLEYTITIDDERMEGCGYTDDFELYNGPVEDYDWFPPNLNFFKNNVLGKS
jgi:transcriptional regulator with XRE-family HTH domain